MFLAIFFSAVFMAVTPFTASAGQTLAAEDYESFDEGTYTSSQLGKDTVVYGYSGAETRSQFKIKKTDSGKKYIDISCAKNAGDTSGVGAAMSVYSGTNVTAGSLVLDAEVSGGGKLAARNLFIIKGTSSSVYTMQITDGGLLGGATQGTYIGKTYFTGAQYVKDSDGFYNLRLVLSRASDADPWDMKVYDRLTSLSEPIYRIEIPAASLKNVNRISLIDLWNSSTDNGYACIKSARLYTADCTDILNGLAFENADGTLAEEYKGADTLYVKLSMNNILTKDISIYGIMSVYNGDILKKAAVYPISLTKGQVVTDKSLELDMSDVTAYDKVTFMMWESGTLTPLMSARRLVYSKDEVNEDEISYSDSNIVKLIPSGEICAADAVSSKFSVKNGEDAVEILEVCYNPTSNELTFYLDKAVSVTQMLTVTSSELSLTDGGSITVNQNAYPYPAQENDLYSFGLISIALYDSSSKPAASAQEGGEYTAALRFINNSGKTKSCRGVLCAKGGTSERLLDKFNIRMNNYSEYKYTKKINLKKDEVITLIIED